METIQKRKKTMFLATEKSKIVYTQLVCNRTNSVLEQIAGPVGLTEQCIEKLWSVQPEHSVVITDTSEFAHPYKFFSPIPKDATINVYADVHGDFEPKGCRPVWSGKASKLEQMRLSAHEVAGNLWSAFTDDGKWVGTSEF